MKKLLLFVVIFAFLAGCAGSEQVKGPEKSREVRYKLSPGDKFIWHENYIDHSVFDDKTTASLLRSIQIQVEVLPYDGPEGIFLIKKMKTHMESASYANGKRVSLDIRSANEPVKVSEGVMHPYQKKLVGYLGNPDYMLLDNKGHSLGFGKKDPRTAEGKKGWNDYSKYVAEVDLFELIAPEEKINVGSKWEMQRFDSFFDGTSYLFTLKNEVIEMKGGILRVASQGMGKPNRYSRSPYKLLMGNYSRETVFDMNLGFILTSTNKTHCEFMNAKGDSVHNYSFYTSGTTMAKSYIPKKLEMGETYVLNF